MSHRIRLTQEAEGDLERLVDFLFTLELKRDSGGKVELAARALRPFKDGIATLWAFPFTCRKADQHPFARDLRIGLGRSG